MGYDIDPDALAIAQENNAHFETSVDFVNLNLDASFVPPSRERPNDDRVMMYDVVVSNPPFGTKKQVGVDARFVQTALQFAPVVYSLHKTSTRQVSNSKPWVGVPFGGLPFNTPI